MYNGANSGLHRLIFEDAPDAVLVLSRDGRVIDRNRAARTAAGRALAAVLEARVPRPEVEAFRAEMEERGRAAAEISITSDLGRVHTLAIEGRSAGEDHVVHGRDVTDRRAQEAELRHLRAVELTGLVTASVVHDFNNLLTAILGASTLLARAVETAAPAQQLAREVLDSAQRAAALVQQIRVRTRGSLPRREPVSLVTAIQETRSLVERVAGDAVSLRLVLDDDAGAVIVDRQALDHVLLNLAANARDAMPGGGQLTIGAARVGIGHADLLDCQAGDYVALTVTDEGSGMTPEVRERVFERFFTTKDAGHGTGLGLAEAHRFVTESGGCITVRSEPGQGTTVVLYLPRVQPDASDVALVPPREVPDFRRGSETILVVDDDDQVRCVVRAVLEERGYRVLEAASGAAALHLVDRHGDVVQLVLADVALGDMGAGVLLDRLRRRGHDTKVLLMSGHSDQVIEAHGVAPDRVVLRKAFSPLELALRVRESLDASSGAAHLRA
jgi:two-component system cell cycle sensor histidine kinase/response regulator CckA